MIETVEAKLKKLLDEIPYTYYEVSSAARFKIADGTLADGRVYPVVFVDQQDMASVDPSKNLLHEHQAEYKKWQRGSLAQLSLSISKLVDIQKNYTAIPVHLQAKVQFLPSVRWSDTVFFNALMASGETHKCIVRTTDPYYCVKLPGNEPSSNIIDVTTLPLDCLDDSVMLTEARPSFCIYMS